ncbi:MAG: hypothetical protein JJT76_05255 [Clostridiaceae bacterium]|nr:hypothetical protein [Clostridiaceae bacterium]
MYYNIIILTIGIIVTIIAAYFLKRNSENSEELYQDMPMSLDSNLKKVIEKSQNKILGDIDHMNEEMQEIKHQLKEIRQLIRLNSQGDNAIQTDTPEDKNFSHLLNYNKFLAKNKKIIDMFHQNKTAEEIACQLNKSVREVEMVTKLIK